MRISRRDFLKFCGVSAAALGLTATDLVNLEKALADPNGPTVIWLQGASCTGCSVSFLNRISSSAPKTAGDALINSVNLVYHPNLMALAGDSAVRAISSAYSKGGYVLVVEGGVPTKFGGNTCWPWSDNGEDVTFQQAVSDLAGRAAAVVCVGTCASWGGIPAAPPNPTGVMGVKAATGVTTINIPGCPTHPDWVMWAVVQLLLGNSVSLDSYGRPKTLFRRTVHDQCPRRDDDDDEHGGGSGRVQDGECLRPKGCVGPETVADCPRTLWNGGTAWCIENNAICIGCTRPTFPGTEPFYMNRGEADD